MGYWCILSSNSVKNFRGLEYHHLLLGFMPPLQLGSWKRSCFSAYVHDCIGSVKRGRGNSAALPSDCVQCYGRVQPSLVGVSTHSKKHGKGISQLLSHAPTPSLPLMLLSIPARLESDSNWWSPSHPFLQSTACSWLMWAVVVLSLCYSSFPCTCFSSSLIFSFSQLSLSHTHTWPPPFLPPLHQEHFSSV